MAGSKRTGKVEIPDSELEDVPEQDREQFITEWVKDEVMNYVEWDWQAE